jgi:putative N6-adenine-specific DNA methylase
MSERFFAPCPRALEAELARELQDLGAEQTDARISGVAFSAPFRMCYRANLESRLASRVLWQVGAAAYRDEDDIYRAAFALDWPRWFDVGRSIMVHVDAHRSPLKSLDFATLRIKDAVCDRFRKAGGTRPNVDTRFADVRIHAYLEAATLTVYLDTSGEPLFKRGYRCAGLEAPLKQNLAAGIIKLTGWRPGEPLFDPMCGSGTLVIEAALIALNRAPGLQREFAFQKLTNFSPSQWKSVQSDAAAKERRTEPLQIFGSDKYGEALKSARANLAAAGLADMVSLKQGDILELPPPAATGVLVANPPYGVRIGEQEQLAAFYPRLGDALKQRFTGWRAYIFSGDSRLPKLIRLAASKRTPLFNGALECRLYEYKLEKGSLRKP